MVVNLQTTVSNESPQIKRRYLDMNFIKCVPMGPVGNNLALVQRVVWHRTWEKKHFPNHWWPCLQTSGHYHNSTRTNFLVISSYATITKERRRCTYEVFLNRFCDVIMSAMVSQLTGVSIVCSTVDSGADERKHQSSASLAFVRGIHRWPVNSPHKGPVTCKMFPFDDVIKCGKRLWQDKKTIWSVFCH